MILITAPHAYCIRLPYRHCDRVALVAAALLSELFPCQLEIADTPREEVDLNRDESLNTPFRQRVREKIPFADILLDIHSFPPGFFGYCDVTVIDEVPGTDYGVSLYLFLEKKVKVNYVNDIKDSIMQESRRMGIPAILIEYCEDITLEKIEEINLLIVEWLKMNSFINF